MLEPGTQLIHSQQPGWRIYLIWTLTPAWDRELCWDPQGCPQDSASTGPLGCARGPRVEMVRFWDGMKCGGIFL